MVKFAHFADVHLGAFREPLLRALNLKAFESALDACEREKVDFIIIAGDLFDIALPDLRIVDAAVKALKKVRDAGIRVYVVYGSHDYSPTETSVIDVIASAGVLAKIPCEFEGDEARLEFIVDAPTGVKLAGMHARKRGLEKTFFERLDRANLERWEGAKVFVFHSALEEWHAFLKAGESVSAGLLPAGFAYYAVGHVHERKAGVIGGKEIVFPGPLSASDFRDLEELAKNEQGHGLYFIELDASRNKIVSKKFHPVEFPQVKLIELPAEGKTAVQASEELLHSCSRADARGKIVLLKAHGELSSGKTSDVDFKRARELLENAGALDVVINHNALSAREAAAWLFTVAASKQELEEKLLQQAHFEFKSPNAFLRENGIETAQELLKAISRERDDGESKGDYEARVTREGLKKLRVTG